MATSMIVPRELDASCRMPSKLAPAPSAARRDATFSSRVRISMRYGCQVANPYAASSAIARRAMPRAVFRQVV
jgi:hypothetical protein